MSKIAVVTTSVRQGRVGLDVANWVMKTANSQKDFDVEYTLVDLAAYNLPLLGSSFATEEQNEQIAKWAAIMEYFDGYIFVVAEYNHAFTGAIKNAIDYLKKEVANKVASFVGYGAFGGVRAIETFRMMLSELQVATTQKTVNFMLAVDFENYSVFKPKDYHAGNAKILFEQNKKWSQVFKNLH